MLPGSCPFPGRDGRNRPTGLARDLARLCTVQPTCRVLPGDGQACRHDADAYACRGRVLAPGRDLGPVHAGVLHPDLATAAD